MWPAFAGLTVFDALVLVARPVTGERTELVGGLLLAAFLNLIVAAVLAPLAGALLRRRRPDLPAVVAGDYAGTTLMIAVAGRPSSARGPRTTARSSPPARTWPRRPARCAPTWLTTRRANTAATWREPTRAASTPSCTAPACPAATPTARCVCSSTPRNRRRDCAWTPTGRPTPASWGGGGADDARRELNCRAGHGAAVKPKGGHQAGHQRQGTKGGTKGGPRGSPVRRRAAPRFAPNLCGGTRDSRALGRIRTARAHPGAGVWSLDTNNRRQLTTPPVAGPARPIGPSLSEPRPSTACSLAASSPISA